MVEKEKHTTMRGPKGTLVIVADGGGARLLRNVGGVFDPELVQEGTLSPRDLDDDGPAGSVPTETRGEEINEATFAKQLARHLNALALRDGFSHAVLMADPQTLGQIRPSLHPEVTGRLVAEIDRNMRNAPLADIARALT